MPSVMVCSCCISLFGGSRLLFWTWVFISVLNIGVDSIKPMVWLCQEGIETADSKHSQVEGKNVWFWQQVGPTPQNILEYCLHAILQTASSVLLIGSTHCYLSVGWVWRNLRSSEARKSGESRREESYFPLDF